ncbi:threonylcarbamoyl-AMP synthase-like [Panonychus citri]|uniref:threonylcarbamoyl-AMP synthase-like n=1 Tax=Panonychus citri TaxID=50023 RepID=UPI0023080DFE|nr:threonylcarbamoyl-AMP synthase-like [Panonychus citri]
MISSMASKLIPVYNVNGKVNSKAVKLACDLITNGGVIGVPTDTIYGILGLAQKSSVVSRIYTIKGRSNCKPLAICLSSVEQLTQWSLVNYPLTVSNLLLSTLLPGPYTLIFERSSSLNPSLNPDTSSIGIRIPNDPFILSIVSSLGQPLALTSANISNQQSSISVNEFNSLWPHLDAVFDGGQLNQDPDRLGSTVIDLTVKGRYKIIRPGCAHIKAMKILENQFNLKQRQD